MKIAVISDTHMPKKAKKLPERLVHGIQGVDLIIHAGDWTSINVYHVLTKIAPAIGVFGNVDTPEIKEKFEEKLVIHEKGYTIGVVHGHIGKKKSTPERALEAFKEHKLDVIVFGHSHIPYKEVHDATILFNPGSPTDKRFQSRFSYGIIELGETIHIEHIFFDTKD